MKWQLRCKIILRRTRHIDHIAPVARLRVISTRSACHHISIHIDRIYRITDRNFIIYAARLQEWVDYANKNGSVIIYDAAYEAYISQEDVPHTIYECDGAQTCAIGRSYYIRIFQQIIEKFPARHALRRLQPDIRSVHTAGNRITC